MKTIIVEDEAIIRLNLKLILENINCVTVGETSNGKDAITLTRKHKPDFICMDIKLQGKLNGIETAQQICEFHEVPILFMSAYSMTEYENLSQFKDKSIFLVKPIQKEQIIKAISDLKSFLPAKSLI